MTKARPFIKWAGGKGQLKGTIRNRLPKHMKRYREPFVGGGAVFFALQEEQAFEQAILNDWNFELIETFRALSSTETVGQVIELLKTYPFEREFFDLMRKTDPMTISQVRRAARFIYLNKTCYNGLYRVNKKGEFNTPIGKYDNPTICDEANLSAMPSALAKALFTNQDFAKSVEGANPEEDVIYFDPPYIPRSETSDFTSYTSEGFNLQEHIRLAKLFRKLASKGIPVLLSNSHTPKTFELYEGLQIDVVHARRDINSFAGEMAAGRKGRDPVPEVLISANLP